MHKIILAVVISLVAGFALGAWISNESGSDIVRPDNAVAGVNLQPLEERLLSLEQLIAEEREARLDLEQQLQSLIDQSDREDASAVAAIDESDSDAVGRRPPQRRSRDFASMMRDFQERRLTGLIDGGFTEDEARRVLHQEGQAEFKAMQAAWEAQRNGETMDPFSAMGSSQELLRGERVYNVSDLRNLTLQGAPGEDVVIEIDRDGVRMQLNVPRGPVGISGSGASIRNMNWLGGG